MPTSPSLQPRPDLRLIVNADDLGAGVARDRGIFAAVAAGSVTSVSLLANGPTTVSAAAEVRKRRIPCGVHLNLADGPPLCGPIPGLSDAAGDLPGKTESRRALAAGTFDRAAVHAELAAQFARIRTLGIAADHFDTHQHALLFPALTPLIIAAARDAGVSRARLPAPAETPAADPADPLGAELALYRRLAPETRRLLHEAGIVTPDGLYGMPLLDRLDKPALLQLLTTLPDGCWELMVHPGAADGDAGDPFGGAARHAELRALRAPAVRRLLNNLQLISFADLPCAC